jgi:hypothetical protein
VIFITFDGVCWWFLGVFDRKKFSNQKISEWEKFDNIHLNDKKNIQFL